MPELEAGGQYSAQVTLTNPTSKSFSYTAELYLGLPKVVSSGVKSFSLGPGISAVISFPVTMPGDEGDYPVYLDVFVGVNLIAAYQAAENVSITIQPEVDIGPIIWE